jgi:hypothetical protein
MSRKTITVDEDVYERLDDVKDDDESWTELLLRLYEAAYLEDEGEHTVNATFTGDGSTDVSALELVQDLHDDVSTLQDDLGDVLTEDHIADIANQTSNQTATEVETRLTQG